jgi:hypothetical protein
MITTVQKAKTLRCPQNMRDAQTCIALNCMAWEFWVPPPGATLQKEKTSHGIRDTEKLGYCGLVKRR